MPIVQDHERLKKEFCRMWQQQEKLLRDNQKSMERLQNDPKMKADFEAWKKKQNDKQASQKAMQNQNQQSGPQMKKNEP